MSVDDDQIFMLRAYGKDFILREGREINWDEWRPIKCQGCGRVSADVDNRRTVTIGETSRMIKHIFCDECDAKNESVFKKP